ncbi:MAG: hypothetical protein NE330_09100, partial [Lentisphaeraceae bacterium]|nr:hypothetical protein [Lentisphaeraceae bacterium]
MKQLRVLREDKDFSYGHFIIDRENILYAEMLYRYDKQKKHIDQLAIAKKGSTKLKDGLQVVTPENKISRTNKKEYSIGLFVDKGISQKGIFRNQFFNFSIKVPSTFKNSPSVVPASTVQHFKYTRKSRAMYSKPLVLSCNSIKVLENQKLF